MPSPPPTVAVHHSVHQGAPDGRVKTRLLRFFTSLRARRGLALAPL